MNYAQFRNLLSLKSIDNKEAIAMLEELIEKFPYFQSARVLLAKAMHDQQDIHYNESLKLASAYATDRKVLHDLMAPPPPKGGNATPPIISSEPIVMADEYSGTALPPLGGGGAERYEEY